MDQIDPDQLLSFAELVEKDWLEAFLRYSSYGEASERLMYWVGVSTVAAVLQRKVWIDQAYFKWVPNFYILIVGEQGTVRKSTSIDIGLDLLPFIEGSNLGPSSTTWQALIRKMGTEYMRPVEMPNGRTLDMTCVTLGISEFGTFFNPEDTKMCDVLVSLWDCRKKFEHETKTAGSDDIPNPWINLIAATTPAWISANLNDNMLQGGLLSRFIYIYGEMPTRDISYPSLYIPKDFAEMQNALVGKLQELSCLAGEMKLTDAAYAWGDAWYKEVRKTLRESDSGKLSSGFLSRKQGHLHKLAMVIAAAKGRFPVIDLDILQEAAEKLESMSDDMGNVFNVVGRTKVTAAQQRLFEMVLKAPEKKLLVRVAYKEMQRTMEWREFEAAVKGAKAAGLLIERGPEEKRYFTLR